ncbi:hypothetical protein OG599_09305 [Streptomyces sp. NBC_01335]|uniref:hypothetical protein n=1 Tax=Streptomyces sp. NBC_01335 TaxID=2903828 RepID=UPI002E12DEF7|nr:hypothetical protein OG599_09305 [Streptomyces sp. NBC_01335]
MSDTQRSVTVTVKSGKDYDSWWAVFRGATFEVYDDVTTFFGFDSETVTSLSLHELVGEASQLAQGSALITRQLGATAIPAPKPAAAGEDPWVAAQATDASPAASAGAATALLEQVAACRTTEELKRLWATNQAAFADQAVMDAWKARGRAIKQAA